MTTSNVELRKQSTLPTMRTLQKKILSHCKKFEETYDKTHELAINRKTLCASCSEDLESGFAELTILKTESDEMLAELGRKTLQYLQTGQGSIKYLASKLRPDQSDACVQTIRTYLLQYVD